MPYSSDSRIAAIEKKRDTLISQSSSTGSGTSERFKRARMFPQNLSIRLSGQTIDSDTLEKLQTNWNVWMTNSTFRQQADALIADPSKTAADLSYPATVSSPLPSIYTGSGMPFVTAQSLADALSPLQAEIDSLEAQGASDAELSAAVASLTTLINSKQDSSNAATDAELASLSASIAVALNLKQDSSTAATDAELAAAVANLQSLINAKQDASSAATDAELAAAVTNLTTLLNGKEPIIAAGTISQYWRGDKSWQAFPSLLALSSTPPSDLGTTAATGTGTTAARADHVHKGPVIAAGTGSTNAILLAGGNVDIMITLSSTMPNNTYKLVRWINPTAVSVLANLVVTEVSKTTTTCTVKLTNNGLASIVAGQVVEVLAISPSA